MTLFSAYQEIHIFCDYNEPLKRSLDFFCGNEYFKHVVDGKVDMKLSDKAREKKKFLGKKKFKPFFSSLIRVLASVGVPLSYRMTLQGIGRLSKLTAYVFRLVHV